jgi:3-deoxy-D-arabino-heptulosonate 7-phosphate (DAHP) synthase class II
MERVIITRPMVGICGMQVCAIPDADDDEILKVCNTQNPSGTEGGWSVVVREVKEGHMFQTKENLPGICDRYNDRKHFVILC